MKLDDIDELEEGSEPIEKGMDEYVWIHATGIMVSDASKTLLKQELALNMVVLSNYSWQKYLKDGKVKSSDSTSVVLLVKRENLEEAMSTLRSTCKDGLYAYALPVLATEIINPKSMKEILFGR